MVAKAAFCPGLHSADAADDHIAVEGAGDRTLQNLRPVERKSGTAQALYGCAHPFIPHDFRTGKKSVDHGEITGRLFVRRCAALHKDTELIRQKMEAVRPAGDPFLYGLLLGKFHHKIREKSLHHRHQIGGTHTLTIPGNGRERNGECPGRLCHIQIQIQTLNKHLLSGCRCQHRPAFRQKFPIHI